MIYIDEIHLNNKTIPLKENQIVCFVGPNSAGKSTALKALYERFYRDGARTSQVTGIKIGNHLTAETVRDYASNKLTLKETLVTAGLSTMKGDTAVNHQHKLLLKSNFNLYRNQILKTIGYEGRLASIKPTKHANSQKGQLLPLQFMYYRPEVEQRLSDICYEIYQKEISLNPGIGSDIVLHVGPRIDASKYRGDRDQRYANDVAKLPLLEDEGDGVRATVGLIASLLCSDAEIFAIDEPDIYLHPPQAYAIAKIIAREKPTCQLFFSTHSSRFVQGLVDADPRRLLLIRLENNSGVFQSRTADVGIFTEIRITPVLKFNNVIDALFYPKTFVCEDSSDCLFYRTSLERLGVSTDESLWFGVNGKTNLPRMVRALKALQVRPITICDFDILNTPDCLLRLVEAYGGDAPALAEKLMKKIAPQIDNNAKLTCEMMKLNGLNALSAFGALYVDVEQVLEDLAKYGIVVNRFGELESLRCPRVGRVGAEGINSMLELDIISDPTLRNARDFCGIVGQVAGL